MRILIALLLATGPLSGQIPHKVDKNTDDRWKTELSNRGSWGKENTRGTRNRNGHAKRKHGTAPAKEGRGMADAGAPHSHRETGNDALARSADGRVHSRLVSSVGNHTHAHRRPINFSKPNSNYL